jgi:nucleoid DNA-binding protein
MCRHRNKQEASPARAPKSGLLWAGQANFPHFSRKIGYLLCLALFLRPKGKLFYLSLPTRAGVAKSTPIEGNAMAKGPLSKSSLIQTIVDKYAANLSRKDVKGIIEAMASIGHAELKKNGLFVVPGLVRMVVVKKPATKARKGINPFTKEPTVFKAKPARKVVKGRPVKAAKDAVA